MTVCFKIFGQTLLCMNALLTNQTVIQKHDYADINLYA